MKRMDLKNKILFIVSCALIGLLIGLILGSCTSHAGPPVTVAVMDTGISEGPEEVPLCKTGHKDFTGEGLQDSDLRLHGTNVASLITIEAGPGTYCLIVLKIFPKKGFNMVAYLSALDYVSHHRYNFVNMSFSGNFPLKIEARLIKSILDHGTKIIAAAGNDHHNLDAKCDSYPACVDPRIIVVSAPDVVGANTGSVVDIYENGAKQAGGGVILSGTSQATARVTGKLVKRSLETP